MNRFYNWQKMLVGAIVFVLCTAIVIIFNITADVSDLEKIGAGNMFGVGLLFFCAMLWAVWLFFKAWKNFRQDKKKYEKTLRHQESRRRKYLGV